MTGKLGHAQELVHVIAPVHEWWFLGGGAFWFFVAVSVVAVIWCGAIETAIPCSSTPLYEKGIKKVKIKNVW